MGITTPETVLSRWFQQQDCRRLGFHQKDLIQSSNDVYSAYIIELFAKPEDLLSLSDDILRSLIECPPFCLLFDISTPEYQLPLGTNIKDSSYWLNHCLTFAYFIPKNYQTVRCGQMSRTPHVDYHIRSDTTTYYGFDLIRQFQNHGDINFTCHNEKGTFVTGIIQFQNVFQPLVEIPL